MKDFTSSSIYHILCNIFDLVILNLCFLLCCLPIVTIGAAVSALHRAAYAIHRDEGSAFQNYFRHFRASLGCGIPLWLLWLAGTGISLADFAIIGLYWDFPGRYLILGVLCLIIVALLLFGCCLFPTLSFRSDWKGAAKSAFHFCFQYLPRMLCVCFLSLLPALIFLFWPYGFLLISAFLLLIWFSLTAYINVIFMRPILEQAVGQE